MRGDAFEADANLEVERCRGCLGRRLSPRPELVPAVANADPARPTQRLNAVCRRRQLDDEAARDMRRDVEQLKIQTFSTKLSGKQAHQASAVQHTGIRHSGTKTRHQPCTGTAGDQPKSSSTRQLDATC
jgi:hypothetical protein